MKASREVCKKCNLFMLSGLCKLEVKRCIIANVGSRYPMREVVRENVVPDDCPYLTEHVVSQDASGEVDVRETE